MRNFSTLAIVLMIATVPAFSEPFNGVIKAQVENGNVFNSKVSKVSLVFGEGDECQVSGTYANGGFTITLPEKPNEKCLTGITGYPSHYNISDKKAKTLVIAKINGFSSNNTFVAEFRLQEISVDGKSYVSFRYVDRDLTIISGGGDEGSWVDKKLKKGWNKVYHIEYPETGNSKEGTSQISEMSNIKWQFLTNTDYSAALQTHFTKGTLGASGKTRPIQMFFQQVSDQYSNIYIIGGKSKTNAAEDTFSGTLSVSEETKGGSCKSDENELKGSYDLTEEESKTSGRFSGTFTACEKNGKLTKASFKGNWIKHSTGSKTPCNFEL